jgi:hypothetical protein
VAQTWARINASLSLSSDGLTVVQGEWTTQANRAAVAGEPVVAGKYYWEITANGSSFAGGGPNVGISGPNISVADGQWIGLSAQSLGYSPTGNVFQNNILRTSIQTYTAGSIICHALDLTHRQIWWRVGISGNWNNNAANDPARNIGGFAIDPRVISAGGVVPAVNTNHVGSPLDSMTAAFAQSSWQGVAPAGFGPFDPVAPLGIGSAPANQQIDAALLPGAASSNLVSPPSVYRETDALADPAAPLAPAPVDPLLGLSVFSAQLAEFAGNLQLVLAELQARSDLLRG